MAKKKAAKAGAAPAPAPAGSSDLVPLRRELAKSLCGETAEARSAVVSRIASLLTDGPDVATISAEILLRLVQRGEQRESLRRVGVPLLVQSLTRHANVVRLIAAASETLNHLVNGNAPLLITAQSATVPLVGALSVHGAHEDVSIQVIAALRCLTTSATGQEALAGNAAALRALLFVVQRHRTSHIIVEHVTGVWRNLACTPVTRACISNDAVFAALISALTMHAGRSGVVGQAARVLQAVAIEPANEALLLTAGAIPPLLRVISPAGEVSSSANPVDAALRALRNIAALPLAKGPIVQQKGIEFVLFALTTHAAQQKVVEAAASLLWSLAHYDEIEYADLPRPAHVVEALAKALRPHRDEESIVRAVSGALWTLALPDSEFARGVRAAATASLASQPDVAMLLPTLTAVAANARLSDQARANATGALEALRRK